MRSALEHAARAAGGRIVAALAARYRDLDLAEEAFAEACARAAARWPASPPRDPAAWLFRVAQRCALDAIRRGRTRAQTRLDEPVPEPSAEDRMTDDAALIPDERLRLIFVCCHPAIAPDSRAALTLRLVCGLETAEIAQAFLVSEPTLAQRLVRAKRKIADAGVPFEVPGPEAWPERLDAVLSTLEIAYSRAHGDAAGAGRHAGFAAEALALTALLTELLPGDTDALALAALVHFAEARRPARLDLAGDMVPLSEQDPARWDRALIAQAGCYLGRIGGGETPRSLQARIHAAWCARASLDHPAPWPIVLALYDALLCHRDDAVIRLNRAVALAEVAGPTAALDEVEAIGGERMGTFLPYQVVRADLLRRVGRQAEARAAYDAALALDPQDAERRWLRRQRDRQGATIAADPAPGPAR